MSEQTFWNYEPTPAERVRVIVGHPPLATWWCAEFEGQERAAVRIDYHGTIYYLDNEDGSGWEKVTKGEGSPRARHRSLPDDSQVIDERATLAPTRKRSGGKTT